MIACDRLELGGRIGDDAGQVDGAPRRLTAGVRPREQQQVGDEPAHPAAGAQRRGGGLAVLAVERLLEQLEVGQHGGQRRAQLVRGVGDELALARERGLGLGARVVERMQHRLQRGRELGDLVIGLRARDRARGVARAGDLAGGVRELGDRLHRAARRRQAGQQGERGAAEHAEAEEQLHAVGGRAHVRDPAPVLREDAEVVPIRVRVDLLVDVDLQQARLDLPAVDHVGLLARRPEVRRPSGGVEVAPGGGDDADRGVVGGRVRVQVDRILVRRLALVVEPRVGVVLLRLQAVGGRGDLAVEVLVDRARRQRADDHGEAEQDHQCERCGASGEAPADRLALIRGVRSPRRGPYGGVEARHRLQASFGDSRRTPRSCS